jgi:hypothetical protein
LRRRKVALVRKHAGEVVEALRRVGMLGAEHYLQTPISLIDKVIHEKQAEADRP